MTNFVTYFCVCEKMYQKLESAKMRIICLPKYRPNLALPCVSKVLCVKQKLQISSREWNCLWKQNWLSGWTFQKTCNLAASKS